MVNTQTHTSPTAGHRTIREVGWGWREAGGRAGRRLATRPNSVSWFYYPRTRFFTYYRLKFYYARTRYFTTRRFNFFFPPAAKTLYYCAFFDHKNARKPPPWHNSNLYHGGNKTVVLLPVCGGSKTFWQSRFYLQVETAKALRRIQVLLLGIAP